MCWNPFNIIIGPNTNHRIGDPGDSFDRITFRAFPSFGLTPEDNVKKLENLARQKTNTYIDRLSRIHGRMKEYVEFQASSTGDYTDMESARGNLIATSVRSLLRSAIPGAYELGFDGRGDAKLAILHPALWIDYLMTP